MCFLMSVSLWIAGCIKSVLGDNKPIFNIDFSLGCISFSKMLKCKKKKLDVVELRSYESR